MNIKRTLFLGLFGLCLALIFSLSSQELSATSQKSNFVVSEPVDAAVSRPLSELPVSQPQVRIEGEINPRHNPLIFEPDRGRRDTWNRANVPPDPLSTTSQNPTAQTPGLELSFDGSTGCNGCSPPDVVGDVGPNHYVSMVNVHYTVFDKSGNSLAGPTPFNTIFAGAGGVCQNANDGDPIPLYDPLADRWLLSQFAGPSHMCIAISQTPDAAGAYYLYEFDVEDFPDYFKFGVWPDGYYMSANENSYTAYVFDRVNMLAGNPATFQKFTGGANLYLPSDLDGATPPPANSPNYFYTFKDSSFHGGSSDRVEIWEFDTDWTTPANTTFTKVQDIAVTAFTYTPCGFFNFNCISQQGTSQKFDGLGEWPMFRFPYRNFSTHESMVGTFVVGGADAENGAAVRWFELRKTDGNWSLHQEGTQDPPDNHNRVNPSIAMDGCGNIALGYTVSSSSLFPSIHYATRLASDPLGTLQSEAVLIAGSGSQTGSNRWGDYSAMSIDPSDDATFWYTNEYYPASSGSGWRTRVGAFKVTEDCSTDDFTISADPIQQSSCVNEDVNFTINVGQIGAFSDPVLLSAPNAPGTSTFTPTSVSPVGSSNLLISGAPLGTHIFDVTGSAGATSHNATIDLSVFEQPSTAPTLNTPANAATNVVSMPTLTWDAVAGATSYAVEIATDAAFTNIVESAADVVGEAYTVIGALDPETTYYWRVSTSNLCGSSQFSNHFSFTTSALVCASPNVDIPDNDVGGVSSDIVLGASPAQISDLNIPIAISHTWVGDITVVLEHVDTGTTATIIERPGGVDSGVGCASNDIAATLDDEGADGSAEDTCNGTPPALGGSLTPNNPLSIFDGENLTGTWRLTVTDGAGIDTGTLDSWCMEAESFTPTAVDLSANDTVAPSHKYVALLVALFVLTGSATIWFVTKRRLD